MAVLVISNTGEDKTIASPPEMFPENAGKTNSEARDSTQCLLIHRCLYRDFGKSQLPFISRKLHIFYENNNFSICNAGARAPLALQRKIFRDYYTKEY